MPRRRLVAIAVLTLIAGIGISIGLAFGGSLREPMSIPGSPGGEEAGTPILKAKVQWAWSGELNGVALDVKAWNRRVYVLVKTDKGELYLYSLNATTGEFINKTLVSKSAYYSSLGLLSGKPLVIMVNGNGEVEVAEYDPASLKVINKNSLGRIDVNVVDVSDVELLKSQAIVAGGIHARNGFKPLLLLLAGARNWSKVVEDSNGYFIDASAVKSGNGDGVICAAASSGTLYCFSASGDLLAKRSLPGMRINKLLAVNDEVLALGVDENGSIRILALNASNVEPIGASTLGKGYPLSLSLADGKLVVLAQTGNGGYVVFIAGVTAGKGVLKVSLLKELSVSIPEVFLYKAVPGSEKLIYLAGRIGVKPFVAAAIG